ncbi:MAG: heavy metal-binding domain-containing protein, partial [Deltaproteobacteria bacterium]|nr:heavy metal-binding domain-containing protein [Deltaproteobacteria bacterium]
MAHEKHACSHHQKSSVPVKNDDRIYTCPMHPEVRQQGPGNCPICGMSLEPMIISAGPEDNHEQKDMTRRFWISTALTVPLLIVTMGQLAVPQWIELVLATPVVLWGGWPFFIRGAQSLLSRHLNMFTLISLGVGVAYIY